MQSAVPLALAMAALAVPPLQARNAITLLLIDGKVWTGNPEKKRAEAVAIAGNRIAAVGSTAQILKLRQRATRVFDLEGHLVLPGFDDARVHFYPGGADLTGPQLRYARSAAEFRDTLADFAAHVPKGQWITGGNWDCEEWKTPRPPSHQLIDSATKNWPVFLKSAGGRMWLANKLALRLASIDRSTP
ncbi:MAG: amidohydrolase family protein, partial [Bryobacteraceae bacterium]